MEGRGVEKGKVVFRGSNQLSERILQSEAKHRLRLHAKPAG